MYNYTIIKDDGRVVSSVQTDAPVPVQPPTKTYRSLKAQMEKESWTLTDKRKVG